MATGAADEIPAKTVYVVSRQIHFVVIEACSCCGRTRRYPDEDDAEQNMQMNQDTVTDNSDSVLFYPSGLDEDDAFPQSDPENSSEALETDEGGPAGGNLMAHTRYKKYKRRKRTKREACTVQSGCWIYPFGGD